MITPDRAPLPHTQPSEGEGPQPGGGHVLAFRRAHHTGHRRLLRLQVRDRVPDRTAPGVVRVPPPEAPLSARQPQPGTESLRRPHSDGPQRRGPRRGHHVQAESRP